MPQLGLLLAVGVIGLLYWAANYGKKEVSLQPGTVTLKFSKPVPISELRANFDNVKALDSKGLSYQFDVNVAGNYSFSALAARVV